MKSLYYTFLCLAFSAFVVCCKKNGNTDNPGPNAHDTNTIINPSNSRFEQKMKQVIFWRDGNRFLPYTIYDFTYTDDGKINTIFKNGSHRYTFEYLHNKEVIRKNVSNLTRIVADTFYFNDYGFPIQQGNVPPFTSQWIYNGELPSLAIYYTPQYYNRDGTLVRAHFDTSKITYTPNGDPLIPQVVYDLSKPAQAADMMSIEYICNGSFPLPFKHSHVLDVAGTDTVRKYNYDYDSQGRIIAITIKNTNYPLESGYFIKY